MPSTVTLGIVAVLPLILLLADRAVDLRDPRAAAGAGGEQRDDRDQGDDDDDRLGAHQSSILSRWARSSSCGERSGARKPQMASAPRTTTMTTMIRVEVDR